VIGLTDSNLTLLDKYEVAIDIMKNANWDNPSIYPYNR
jgi:hypothetical protein